MKKILFVAAATTLALSSCSDNEITSVVEKAKTPISINVYSQSKTRAVTETTTAVLQANGFKFVALNGTTEMINTTAAYDATAGAWSYGENVYWPTNVDTAIKFYGLYPGTVTLNAANDKATITVDGSTDVVAAYNSKSLSTSTSGAVNLSFAHVLAEVLVRAVGNNSDFTYNVTSLTFSEPATVDYTFSAGTCAATTGAATSNFAYLTAAEAASTEAPADLGSTVVLPAINTTLTITYTVTKGADSNTLIKSANITGLAAGSLNVINLTLPSERTAMSFTVDNIPTWTAGTGITPTWN